MRISVVGSGYVGLVSGAGLSDVGHHVLCMDIDEARIEEKRADHGCKHHDVERKREDQ